MSFLSALLGNEPREAEDTRALAYEVSRLRAESAVPDQEAALAFISGVMEDASAQADAVLGDRLGKPVFELVCQLFDCEPFGISITDDASEACCGKWQLDVATQAVPKIEEVTTLRPPRSEFRLTISVRSS